MGKTSEVARAGAVLTLMLALGACDEDRGPGGTHLPDGLYDSSWSTSGACALDVPAQVLVAEGTVSLWRVCPVTGHLTFMAQARFEFDGETMLVQPAGLYDCDGHLVGSVPAWRIEPDAQLSAQLATAAGCINEYAVQLFPVMP